MVAATAPATVAIPEALQRLGDLAYNVWWSWHSDVRRIFRNLDPMLWEAVNGNPVLMLHRATPEAWSAAIKDDTVRESVVTQWQRSQGLTSLKYSHLDHAFETPKITLDSAQRNSSLPKPGDLEVFDYPGGFVNLGHDLDKGTPTAASEAKRLAQLRVDAFESAHTVIGALSPSRYVGGVESVPPVPSSTSV